MGWFSSKKKPAPPKKKTLDKMNNDELKEFQKGVRKQLRVSIREIDRNIFDSERTLKSSEKELEKKMKEGVDRNVLRVYAQNIVKARSTRDKHKVNRAKVQGIEYSINQMVMNAKMTSVMGQAGKIMGKVQNMTNINELSNNMMNLERQFEKHGIIAEMMDDAMDDMDEDVDADEAVEDLLDQVQAKVAPKKKKVTQQQTQQETDLDDQIKNLTL